MYPVGFKIAMNRVEPYDSSSSHFEGGTDSGSLPGLAAPVWCVGTHKSSHIKELHLHLCLIQRQDPGLRAYCYYWGEAFENLGWR